MGGLLGAGLLGMLFGAGFFGGLAGLGSMLGFLIQIALVVFLVSLAVRWFRRRETPAYAGAGHARTAAGGLGGPGLSLRVEQGSAFEEIARAVKSTKPDLVVVGTHGRSGLMKVLLGSVTDDVLRHLEVDILVVPPAGRNARPEAGRA